MELSLNVYYTIALAVIILLVGDFIKKRCYILRKFCIPVPVVGGLLFTILLTITTMTGVLKVSLDSSFNEFFSLLFYAGIGYTASWKMLKKGGPQVIIFLILSSILVQSLWSAETELLLHGLLSLKARVSRTRARSRSQLQPSALYLARF